MDSMKDLMSLKQALSLIESLIDDKRLMVFDLDSKTFKRIESAGMNGECIQLTAEQWGKDERV